MVTINRKRLGDNTYRANFGPVEITVHAVTRYQARQKAIEHFRPKNRERDLIEVELISED